MKKIIIILMTGILLPFFTQAQLSKLISTYQGKNGVTITHLDKNLYGLYKKKNLSPEAENLLKELKEVNIISFDSSWTPAEIIGKFTEELQKKGYNMVKSATSSEGKQFIYCQSENDKLSDLVVISQKKNNPTDIIELRGTIQTENIALLSRALNINGLSSLSALNPNNEKYTSYVQSYSYSSATTEKIKKQAEEMKRKAEEMKRNLNTGTNLNFDFSGNDSSFINNLTPGLIDSIFNAIGSEFGKISNVFNAFGCNINDLGNSISSIGSSIQITEDNGKTKIKINTKNLDIIYIVDGIRFEGEEVTMPEQIKYVNLINDPQNSRKSYLIVTSASKLGEFVSLKDNVLRFKYDKQDFKYNLTKSDIPLLWINGAAATDLSGIDIPRIQQIRPVTKAEKETGGYKNAEVFITTK